MGCRNKAGQETPHLAPHAFGTREHTNACSESTELLAGSLAWLLAMPPGLSSARGCDTAGCPTARIATPHASISRGLLTSRFGRRTSGVVAGVDQRCLDLSTRQHHDVVGADLAIAELCGAGAFQRPPLQLSEAALVRDDADAVVGEAQELVDNLESSRTQLGLRLLLLAMIAEPLALQRDQVHAAHERKRLSLMDRHGWLPLITRQAGTTLPEALAHVHTGMVGEDNGCGLQRPLQRRGEHTRRHRQASVKNKLLDDSPCRLDLLLSLLGQRRVEQVHIRQRGLPRSRDVLGELLARRVEAGRSRLLRGPAGGPLLLDVVDGLPVPDQPHGLPGDDRLGVLKGVACVVLRALNPQRQVQEPACVLVAP
mmetsp:Transcript_58449/g.163749  ORF Transcript_58449/g.163749 Transcript_58449/m.163749 type:complete len:369 (-) Transcript_58449:320-1426(-)